MTTGLTRDDSGVRAATVDAVRDDALGSDDATALLQRLARREVSAAELRAAAAARARAVDPALRAVTEWVEAGVAPEIPVAPDAPLAGIPTVVKDNEELTGYLTSSGSWAVADRRAAASSPWVAQFVGLGVQPIAKTTLPEFGLTATTESSRFGATRNPWDTTRSTGGSSGGSAALVASGAVPIAHANDGGGSIRIPASCCGLVGLKPSRGRLADRPELERLPVPLTTQGMLSRTVRDTALYYAAAERVYRNPALPEIGHVTGPGRRRLRVALVTETIRGLPVAATSVAAARRTAALLESLGHHVEETPPPVDDRFGPDFLRYWTFLSFVLKNAGGQLFGAGFDRGRVEPFTSLLADLFRRQAPAMPVSMRRLRRLARDHEPTLGSYDVLLSPTLGHEPPPIGYLGPDVDPREHLLRLLRFSTFTPVQNVSGTPAISLPLGRTDDGLPVGVQLSAGLGQERVLLELAYELEEAAPWPLRPGVAEGVSRG